MALPVLDVAWLTAQEHLIPGPETLLYICFRACGTATLQEVLSLIHLMRRENLVQSARTTAPTASVVNISACHTNVSHHQTHPMCSLFMDHQFHALHDYVFPSHLQNSN